MDLPIRPAYDYYILKYYAMPSLCVLILFALLWLCRRYIMRRGFYHNDLGESTGDLDQKEGGLPDRPVQVNPGSGGGVSGENIGVVVSGDMTFDAIEMTKTDMSNIVSPDVSQFDMENMGQEAPGKEKVE